VYFPALNCRKTLYGLEGDSLLSTLTKISVVVLFVLAVVQSIVLINMAVVPTNWKAAYEGEREAKDVANSTAQQAYAAKEVADKQYRDELQRNQQLTSDKIAGDEAKNAEITRLTREKAKTEADLVLERGNTAIAANALKDAVEQNKAKDLRLADGQKRNIELEDQLRRAKDQIAEYTSDLDTLNRTVKWFKEMLAQRDLEIKEMGEKLAAAGATSQPAGSGGVKAAKIDAVVNAVQGEVVALNQGEASGVKKGMKFYIYRDKDFVGYVKIEEVLATSSAGVAYDSVRKIRQGDLATTNLDSNPIVSICGRTPELHCRCSTRTRTHWAKFRTRPGTWQTRPPCTSAECHTTTKTRPSTSPITWPK
jgi:hypothetical protein